MLSGALPASAPAQNAPPGNSGVDQYLETVPDAGGDRPPGGRQGIAGESEAGGRSGPGAALPARTSEELEAAGKDGAALERLVSSAEPRKPGSAPRNPAARSDSRRAADSAGSVLGTEATGEARSAPAAVAGTALGGKGTGAPGWILPLLLACTTLGAVTLVLRRRRW
jgi:hypothetical protein